MTQSSGVYISDKYSEPMSPQHQFAQNYDLDNPAQAMSSYARIMHEHTKRQLSSATSSARRRSEGVTPGSCRSSVSSTDS